MSGVLFMTTLSEWLVFLRELDTPPTDQAIDLAVLVLEAWYALGIPEAILWSTEEGAVTADWWVAGCTIHVVFDEAGCLRLHAKQEGQKADKPWANWELLAQDRDVFDLLPVVYQTALKAEPEYPEAATYDPLAWDWSAEGYVVGAVDVVVREYNKEASGA